MKLRNRTAALLAIPALTLAMTACSDNEDTTVVTDAPEDTKINSCPASFRSESTLTSSSTRRMFSRPVAWARVEVPTFTTILIE